ncbi:MAG: L,D-transpeptidase [Ancalomicrobiaceae bacterium]|nr:L,D-transpeptidase [Ancalomicrobiaceae bacterium]
MTMARRTFLLGAPLALAACAGTRLTETEAYFEHPVGTRLFGVDPDLVAYYGPLDDERFPVPALDLHKIDPQWLRQEVAFSGPYQPGTVVVDPGARHLYHVNEGGRAIRYGVGVGREGFGWNGQATIKRKSVWPTWTPPAEMVQRDPLAKPYANGMPGGPQNPLGARALYLYQGDHDTLYRLHGTYEPESIGTAVSSGCIRLFNHDIIDLYNRTPTGTRVVVLPTLTS